MITVQVISSYECRICGHQDRILVPVAILFLFVIWEVLTNLIWTGFGCMQVNHLLGGQKRWKTLAKMQSRSPSVIVWRWFSVLLKFFPVYVYFTLKDFEKTDRPKSGALFYLKTIKVLSHKQVCKDCWSCSVKPLQALMIIKEREGGWHVAKGHRLESNLSCWKRHLPYITRSAGGHPTTGLIISHSSPGAKYYTKLVLRHLTIPYVVTKTCDFRNSRKKGVIWNCICAQTLHFGFCHHNSLPSYLDRRRMCE